MVVDPQGKAVQILLVVRRQQVGRCHIHRHQGISTGRFCYRQAQQAAVQKGGGLGIVQDMGGFAQLPQSHAQRRGRTDGIAVGPGMGQDTVIVMGEEPLGALIPRHRGYHRAGC